MSTKELGDATAAKAVGPIRVWVPSFLHSSAVGLKKSSQYTSLRASEKRSIVGGTLEGY